MRCCEWDDKPDHATLPSCGRSGFTLEVGPVPQGVADAVTYQKTLELIDSILDAVEARNQALLSKRAVLLWNRSRSIGEWIMWTFRATTTTSWPVSSPELTSCPRTGRAAAGFRWYA